MPAGMLTGKCIVETIAKQAIDERSVAQPIAVARLAEQERGLIHILHATGDHTIGIFQHDLLGGGNDRLGTGAADPVHRHRRHAYRQARADRCLACRIHPRTRLQNLAHHHRVDRLARQPRTFQRSPDRDGAQIGCGDIFQTAAECADGGAYGRTDNSIKSRHGCLRWMGWGERVHRRPAGSRGPPAAVSCVMAAMA